MDALNLIGRIGTIDGPTRRALDRWTMTLAPEVLRVVFEDTRWISRAVEHGRVG